MSDYRVHAVRVFADDVAAAAEFYGKALGLVEITRMTFPGVVEILMNSGKDVAEAAANPAPQFAVMTPQPGPPLDSQAHIVLHASDFDGSIASFTAAGGSIVFGPQDINGVKVAFVKDPFGNVIEFLKLPH